MDEYFMDVTFLLKRGRQAIEAYVRDLKQAVYQQTGLGCIRQEWL
jgi:hypothetical protein